MIDDAVKERMGQQALVLLGAVGVLLLTALTDYAVDRMRLLAQGTFRFTPYLWVLVAGNLLVAFMLLVFAWYVLRFRRQLRIAGAVLVVLGLILLFYPLLFFQVGLSLPPAIARILVLGQANTRLGLSAAFTTILGAYLLLPLRDEDRQFSGGSGARR